MSEKPKILVVEDDEELRSMIAFYLEKNGYAVVQETDGEAGLAAALKTPFDLILMDVVMPKLDGYHVCQELSEKLGAKCPRVIIMTSRDLQKEAKLAFACGAMATLQKPIRLVELKGKIERLLNA